jgi:hypothetical protein
MSAKLPWFKFEATTWLSDPYVRLMSSRQRGWYIDLLCWAWQEGGFDPEVADIICQTARDSEYADRMGDADELKQIRTEMEGVLSHFTVSLENGFISHPKLEEMRTDIARKAQKQREGGLMTQAKLKAKQPANLEASSSLPQANHISKVQVRASKAAASSVVVKASKAEQASAAAAAAGLPANRAAQTPDEICAAVLREMDNEGLMPPRLIANEYGREEPNPVTQRIEAKLRSRLDAIREARFPDRLARKIILDELGA